MDYYYYLAPIPGIGNVTITDLLSEVASLTQYEHPRQLIEPAELTLCKNSSDQQKGQIRISKRGRRKLRALLFHIMMPLICIIQPLSNYRNITPHTSKPAS